MTNYVKKYKVKNLRGLTPEEYNEEVAHAIDQMRDLYPYNDRDYDNKVIRSAISYVDTINNPDFINQLDQTFSEPLEDLEL